MKDQNERRKCGCRLSPRAARYLIFTADYVKLHEVRRAADKQWCSRHNSDDITALYEMFFEQPFFGDQDKLLDVLHLNDRSRHHAPVERESSPRFLDRRKRNDGRLRAVF